MSPRPVAVAGWLVFALTATSTLAAAATTDWPAFRGHRGDGAAAAGILDPAKGLEVVWKRPIGSGYSAISTAGGLGVTMAVDGEHDVVLAFDLATGKDRWKHQLAPFYKGHDGSDDGPIATPAIAGGRVFALGPRGHVVALELADGKVAWSRTLGESDARAATYGHAASPVPVDDLILVLSGGPAGKTLLALRQGDGALAWSWGDDQVGYQTPLIADVAGERQVVVFTNRHLAGLDPKTGAERWKHEHSTGTNVDFSGQPVELGDGRFLIQLDDESAVVTVSREGEAWRTSQLWRSNAIQRSFAVPVLHEGTIYGYSGRFLTAVDPATGKTLWKSRPPGGLGLSLVDGQLVIVGDGGALVRVKAEPGGYEEVGRAAALGEPGYSTPTVIGRPDGGLVLVRNLEEMAALRVTAGAADLPVVVNAGAAPVAAFAELLSAVEKAPAAERQARVDAFLAAQKSLPLVDPSGRVTFVARAKSDVGLNGNWSITEGELAMVRVPGTDLFYRTVDLDPAAHYEYRLGIDYADPAADPANPLRTAGPQGSEGSDLRMPGFRVPAHLAAGAPEPAAKGKLETFELESKLREGKREITVYLPAGYESGSERYPLVIVNHGAWAKDFGAYPRVLDGVLAAGAAPPAIVAFVPRTGFPEYGTDLVDAYADMVVKELLPALDAKYRTDARRAARAIIGVTSGGQAALRTVARHPDAFGFLGVQTFFRVGPYREKIFPLVREAKLAGLRAWVESSPNDLVDPRQSFDSPGDTRELIELLKSAGAEVQVSSTAGPGSWGRWRSTLDLLLAAFVPAG